MLKKLLFISHASEDSEIALALKSYLAADFEDNFEIYVSSDSESITAGCKWQDELEHKLENTDIIIALCGPNLASKPWIFLETGAVWLRKKPVIPVCHSGMTKENLTPPLNSREAIILTDDKDIEKLYVSLIRILNSNKACPSSDRFKAIAQKFSEIISHLVNKKNPSFLSDKLRRDKELLLSDEIDKNPSINVDISCIKVNSCL